MPLDKYTPVSGTQIVVHLLHTTYYTIARLYQLLSLGLGYLTYNLLIVTLIIHTIYHLIVELGHRILLVIVTFDQRIFFFS